MAMPDETKKALLYGGGILVALLVVYWLLRATGVWAG
jgi:hypothetical protein